MIFRDKPILSGLVLIRGDHKCCLPLHAYFGCDPPSLAPPGDMLQPSPGARTLIPQLTEAGVTVNYFETQASVGETAGEHL